jgi:glycerophosphoryl diester phosphodiesterase
VSHFARWPWPRVLAHRGAGSLAPENTLAALRAGVEHGFRAVEFDAMVPLDDVPVLMHDATLKRTTGVSGRVCERESGQLAQLDAGRWHSARYACEPVPLLADALAYCRANSVWSNVEIKPAPGHEARTGALVARVVASEYADWLVAGGDQAKRADPRVPLLSSFSEAALEAARAAAPDLPRALLRDRVPANLDDLMQRLGALSLHTDHRRLDAAGAQAVKQAGYWLLCYTVNEPARARELFDWGVDALCTDRIDLIGPAFE